MIIKTSNNLVSWSDLDTLEKLRDTPMKNIKNDFLPLKIDEIQYNSLPDIHKGKYSLDFTESPDNQPYYILEGYNINTDWIEKGLKHKITELEYNALSDSDKELYISGSYYLLDKDYKIPDEISWKWWYLDNVDKAPLCDDNLPLYDCIQAPLIDDLKFAINKLLQIETFSFKDKELKSIVKSLKTVFKLDTIDIDSIIAKSSCRNLLDFICNNVSLEYNQDLWSYNNDKISKLKGTKKEEGFYYRINYEIWYDFDIGNDSYSETFFSGYFNTKNQFYNHNRLLRSIIQRLNNYINNLIATDNNIDKHFDTIPYNSIISYILGFTNNLPATITYDNGKPLNRKYTKNGISLLLPYSVDECITINTHYLLIELLKHIGPEKRDITFNFKKYFLDLGYKDTKDNYIYLKEKTNIEIYKLSTALIENENNEFGYIPLFEPTDKKIKKGFINMRLSKDFHKLLYPNMYDDSIPYYVYDKKGIRIINQKKLKCTIAYIPKLISIYRKNMLAGQLLLKICLYYNQVTYNKHTKRYEFKNIKQDKETGKEFVLFSIWNPRENTGLIKNTILENRLDEKDKSTYIKQPLETALDLLETEGYITEWTYRKAKGECMTTEEFNSLTPEKILMPEQYYIAISQKEKPII